MKNVHHSLRWCLQMFCFVWPTVKTEKKLTRLQGFKFYVCVCTKRGAASQRQTWFLGVTNGRRRPWKRLISNKNDGGRWRRWCYIRSGEYFYIERGEKNNTEGLFLFFSRPASAKVWFGWLKSARDRLDRQLVYPSPAKCFLKVPALFLAVSKDDFPDGSL